MANINITNLPVAIALTGNEKLMVTSGATSYSATTGQIAGLAANVGTVTSIATASPISGGTITTTGTISLQAAGVDNSYLSLMPTLTIKGNATGISATPQDLTVNQTMTLLGAAPLNSPAFTGTPTAPTPATSDNSTTIATTAFVKAQGAGAGTVTTVNTGAGLTGGPITTSGTISLTTTGVTPATYGALAYLPQITVDAYGRLSSASNILITPANIGAASSTTTITAGTGLTGGGDLSANRTIALASVAAGYVIGNPTTGSAQPTGVSLSSIIDESMGNVVGSVLYRSTGGWTTLGPGTSGQVLRTQGLGNAPTWATVTGTGTVINVDTGTGLTGGPITTTGTISIANTGVTAATYGSASKSASFTVNAQGQLTNAAETNIAISASQITSGQITNSQLQNSSLTVGSTTISLGGTATSLAGLSSVTVTADPTSNLELATKQYVDSVAAGINYHPACNYATTVDLGSVAYSNGSSGVGATLTKTSPFATLSMDGYTFVAGDVGKRVLVKNESNAAYNGIYTVTDIGSGSVAWVLTRATDFDQVGTGQDEIGPGDTTFVLAGTVNANTQWTQTTELPITIGTTSIVFVQVGAQVTYSAGTGLTLVGTTFSLSTPVSIGNGGTGQTTASAAFNALSPITTTGDLILGNGTNSATRLGIGANGYVLTSDGTTASWAAIPATGVTSFQTSLSGLTPSSSSTGAITLAGTLGPTSGGTGITSYATGDLLYASATNTLSKITAGTNGYVLTMSGGIPAWVASNGGVTSFSGGSTGLTPAPATTGAITLGGTLATGNGGTGLTSFTSGGAVYASSTSVLTTGTLPIASGGTGQITASAAFNALSPITSVGDLIIGTGVNTASRLPIGSNGYVLTSNGTTATWAAATGGVTSISFGTTGLTPSTATGGAVTVAGTLAISNGGTGATTVAGAQTSLQVDPAGTAVAMAIALG